MIALVWQFDVKAGKNEAFEAFYGADGAWTALGRRSRSFLGASFLRDLAMGQRYLVVEYLERDGGVQKHHADFQDETERLEKQRDALVEQTQPLGLFNALDVPDRDGPTWSQRSGVQASHRSLGG